MALKKKITKAEHAKLADHFKTEYKADGEDFVLDVDGDEDLGPLKNANERLKAERKEAKDALRKAEERLAELEDGDNKKKGDVAALEKSWEKKLNDQKAEAQTKIDKLTGITTKHLVDNVAISLANELSQKAPKILLPHIKARLAADFEGDEPKTRILDAAGKPSALTLADLKKEFVDNSDFSAIITASKATGGAGGEKKIPGGAPQDKPVILSQLGPKELAAEIKARKEAAT